LSEEIPADSRASRIAAARKADSTPVFDPSANCASASERDSLMVLSDLRSLPCTTDSSTILAMKIVQVISEAKASPIMTALTMMSADRNIDHGDRSCGTGTVAFSDFALSPPASAAGAAPGGGDGDTVAGDGAADDEAPCPICGEAVVGAGACATGVA